MIEPFFIWIDEYYTVICGRNCVMNNVKELI